MSNIARKRQKTSYNAKHKGKGKAKKREATMPSQSEGQITVRRGLHAFNMLTHLCVMADISHSYLSLRLHISSRRPLLKEFIKCFLMLESARSEPNVSIHSHVTNYR